MKKNQPGFSLIELIFAGAIFTVFATGVVGVLLFGLDMDRLSEETFLATEYAKQGEESVRFMGANNFDEVTLTSATGIEDTNGSLSFVGTENVNEKYTRVIAVEEVKRDASGSIDENNGTIDPDTKKIRTTVFFHVAPSRSNSVVLETYLTRFK
ncbi:MAG: hypothetical protein COZ86_00100 [Candidatus Moranbacteria bacterium CG_4_8_14_3_um_filter_41_13]|nr:MAG: hypothetical protein AUK58_04090 [Candidatus Moranbacteria bacterium CG2_30_41_165]PIV86324.1 MAG: hypothetical protein COW50_02085 [Candidatus Moranbacteria bacterium CG17_big_fil_post_rev_8_21_14_2_50_41_107]PIW94609.1 MAG: hypothetical protein COZ86_00100 [Candidatus Moranbacteria bacterium CG_4_8_14_3_um_filter_41_13]